MRVFKTKRKKNYLSIYLILILVETFYLINYIGSNLSTNLINVIKNDIDTVNDELINEYLDISSLKSSDIDNLIELIRKDNNEIIGLNYKVNNAYNLLDNIVSKLKNNCDYIILKYPIGYLSNNMLLKNLGYKIPIKVELVSSILTGLKTKVSNYGINNSLVELYLSINVSNNVIYFAINDKQTKTYEILLGSTLVVGSVPSYLNGEILKNTTSIN